MTTKKLVEMRKLHGAIYLSVISVCSFFLILDERKIYATDMDLFYQGSSLIRTEISLDQMIAKLKEAHNLKTSTHMNSKRITRCR